MEQKIDRIIEPLNPASLDLVVAFHVVLTVTISVLVLSSSRIRRDPKRPST